jgi:hypothetical protein
MMNLSLRASETASNTQGDGFGGALRNQGPLAAFLNRALPYSASVSANMARAPRSRQAIAGISLAPRPTGRHFHALRGERPCIPQASLSHPIAFIGYRGGRTSSRGTYFVHHYGDSAALSPFILYLSAGQRTL